MEELIIENRSMNQKQNSKYVSQLDLKFLQLKFLTLSPDRLPLKNSHTISYQLPQTDKSKNDGLNADTNDVTYNGNTTVNSVKEAEIETRRNMKDILDYISIDTNEIYRRCENSLLQANDGQKDRKGNKFGGRNRGYQEVLDQITHQKIESYESKIGDLEKENDLIHKEITKLYFESEHSHPHKTAQGAKMKQVKKIQLVSQADDGDEERANKRTAQNQNKIAYFKASDKSIALGKDYLMKKMSEMKNGVFDSGCYAQKQMKMGSGDASAPPSLERSGSKNLLLGLQKEKELNRNRYEHFYEKLYEKGDVSDEKRGKRRQQKKSENNYPLDSVEREGETLEVLKKKMINNNFDKNFESFLVERRIRVPEILKKMR